MWAEIYAHGCAGDALETEKLLSLMAAMDNYSDYLLLWSPRDKKLWYLDIEHEEFHPLAKWDDFIADPGRYLNGMIEAMTEKSSPISKNARGKDCDMKLKTDLPYTPGCLDLHLSHWTQSDAWIDWVLPLGWNGSHDAEN